LGQNGAQLARNQPSLIPLPIPRRVLRPLSSFILHPSSFRKMKIKLVRHTSGRQHLDAQ
jgi:hypothetical protein